MSAHPALPERLTFGALQSYVARMVEARKFTQDLDRVFILWVEELGELAEHLASAEGKAPDPQALGSELADVTLYIADLANGFGVELDAAIRAAPQAVHNTVPVDGTLSDWQAAIPELTQESVASAIQRMMMAAGELARVVRKQWSGKHDSPPAAALAQALDETLKIARAYGIDLTRAIEDKETENAGRIWTY